MAQNPYEGIMFPVKAVVVEESGRGCRAPHTVGQEWYMKGVPAGICSFAFNSMFPAYWTLRFGGSDPSEVNPDHMHVRCSGINCGATFRLSRITDDEAKRLQRASDLIPLSEVTDIGSGISQKIS